jgi:hypothetical protein
VVNTATPYDWYVATSSAETRNDNLWGGKLENEIWSTEKTIFDPCPSGWKVAPIGTWHDFTAAGNGGNHYNDAEAYGQNSPFPYYINGTKQTANGMPTMVDSGRNGRYYTHEAGGILAWYPAAGQLHNAGGLGAVGNRGHYWSSSANNFDPYNIGFHNSILYPSHTLSRTFGESVRCLQE